MLFFAPFAQNVFASTGFVDSPLWISPASPNEGEMVTLSALFHNAEPETITGSIDFYDGTTLLDEKAVTLRSDEVATVSTSFAIPAGTHLFSASSKGMSQISTTGTLQVIPVALPDVKLPMEFVSKTIVPAADAGNSVGDDSTSMILQQVSNAQNAVLSALPPDTKATVTNTTNAVDNWRAAQAADFVQSRDAAQSALNATNPSASTARGSSANTVSKKPSTAKTTQKPANSEASAGPFTYVKYLVFSALAFLFGSAVVFYLAALLIIYLIFRFIFSRFRRKKKEPRAPKTSDFQKDH